MDDGKGVREPGIEINLNLALGQKRSRCRLEFVTGMKCFRLILDSHIDETPVEVFRFLENPNQTPNWNPSDNTPCLLAAPGGLDVGAHVGWEIKRWRWLRPSQWIVETTAYKRFCGYEQTMQHGPFRYWKHHCQLFPEGRNGTVLRDTIEFRLRWGSLGVWLGGRSTVRWVRTLFHCRQEIIRLFFASKMPKKGPAPVVSPYTNLSTLEPPSEFSSSGSSHYHQAHDLGGSGESIKLDTWQSPTSSGMEVEPPSRSGGRRVSSNLGSPSRPLRNSPEPPSHPLWSQQASKLLNARSWRELASDLNSIVDGQSDAQPPLAPTVSPAPPPHDNALSNLCYVETASPANNMPGPFVVFPQTQTKSEPPAKSQTTPENRAKPKTSFHFQRNGHDHFGLLKGINGNGNGKASNH